MDSHHHERRINYDGAFLRQYRLILYTSYELIALCVIIMLVYAYSNVWDLVALIGISCIVACMNVWLLIHSQNTYLCGHISVSLTLLTIVIANYLIGGFGTPYSIWFYVIPLLAVSLTGWKSLLLYSGLSFSMIILFGIFHVVPVSRIPSNEIIIIEWANHLIAFLVIVTTLNSLMRENKVYEMLLNDKNFLLQAEKDRFKHLSRYDQLTNLPNRHYFLHQLQEKIDALSNDELLTVFFMDLDNLKYVNDYYGHIAGDHLIRQTAKRLLASFRKSDFVARLGGDEFTAIVIHKRDELIAEDIAKRIEEKFNQPIRYNKHEYLSTISLGLATYPTDAKNLSNLMIKADSRMYDVKKNHNKISTAPHANK